MPFLSSVFSARLLKSLLPLSALAASAAFALSLSDLSNGETASGLKAALEQGSAAAVSRLGTPGGFLDNETVRIRLPGLLEQARPLLQMAGRGAQLDELAIEINRAAESAVPLARPLLIDAVKSMTITDAKNILTGGDTSVTEFFRARTSDALAVKFLPMVKSVTDRSGLAVQYNAAMAQALRFGLVSREQATVESYVTQRALDGLFTVIGEEEKAIRRDPFGAGSKIIGKVFGSTR